MPLSAVPPVPVPLENPITEPKRVLGKILFWDEQLSSDGTVACGTCHRPAFGGADPRAGRYPGVDKGTIDDVHGSPGHREPRSRRASRARTPCSGTDRRSRRGSRRRTSARSGRTSCSGTAAPRTQFKDPLTGATAIARGGALENQAVAALLNVDGDGEARPLVGRRDRGHRARGAARARDELAARRGRRARAAPDLPAAVRGRVRRRRRSRRCGSRSRSRPISARSSSDETAWDRFDAGDTSRVDGPRAVRLARAASVPLRRVPHAAAVHEQRVLPDRRAPRRLRPRPRARHARPRGRRRDEGADAAQRGAAAALHAHGRVHEPRRGDRLLHQRTRAAGARRHSGRGPLHLQHEPGRRERHSRVHRDGARRSARARRDVPVRSPDAAQRAARQPPAARNEFVAATLLPSAHFGTGPPMGKPGNTGLRRIVNATFFSFAGLARRVAQRSRVSPGDPAVRRAGAGGVLARRRRPSSARC